MKIGDTVTVQGTAAKNGTNRANARTVTTPDGKKWAASGEARIRSQIHRTKKGRHR
jgi:hypothetical protein